MSPKTGKSFDQWIGTSVQEDSGERLRIRTARDRVLHTILKTGVPWKTYRPETHDVLEFAARRGTDSRAVDLLPQFGRDDLPDSFQATFTVEVGRARFQLVGPVARHGSHWSFGRDFEVFSLARRRTPRIPWREPIAFQTSAGVRGRASVQDIAQGGLSVVTDDMLAVGEEIEFLGTNRAKVPSAKAVVRWVRAQQGSRRAGMEFTFPVHGQALTDLVREYFPRLHSRAEFPPATVRKLFEDSNYLNLTMDSGVSRAWLRLEDPEISHNMVFADEDGQLVGHMSYTQSYRNAWTAHQLASVPNHRESAACWRELYRFANTWPRLADSTSGLIAIFPFSPWNRRLLDNFSRWLEHSDAASVVPFSRLSVPDTMDGPLDPTIAHLAGVNDLAAIGQNLAEQLPSVVVDNLDLSAERLRSAALHPVYADRNVQRKREVIVVKREGKVVACALCELSDAALSLFNLFNMAYFFPIDGAPPLTKEETAHLLRAIGSLYERNALRLSMVLTPEPYRAPLQAAGCEHVEDVGLVNWSHLGLRHWQNYIDLTFAVSTQKEARRRTSPSLRQRNGSAIAQAPRSRQDSERTDEERTMNNVERYEGALQSERQRLAARPGIETLLDPALSKRKFMRYMIEFCSRAVPMTVQVEDWIRRAGHRTADIGMEDIGRRLATHAKAEAGHDQMLVRDAAVLVEHYNELYGTSLDSQALIDRPILDSTRDYIELHEQVIASNAPYLQVAIELEIEGLSVSVGASIIDQYKRLVGADQLGHISFLTEHVEVDVGHTAFNLKLLGRLLDERPDSLSAAIETGTRALDIYGRFLHDLMTSVEAEEAAWRLSATDGAASSERLAS